MHRIRFRELRDATCPIRRQLAVPSVTFLEIGKHARTLLHVARSITDPIRGHSALIQSRAYLRRERVHPPRG